MDPISARDGRDVRPQCPRLRGGACESLSQICRHVWLRFLCRRRDLEGDNVACVSARRFTQLPVHFEPVALLAVWLERGLERDAIDFSFNRRHAPRGELRTGVLWQDEKGPGAGLSALGRPEEFCFETDLGSGFGHLLGISNGREQIGRAIHRLPDCMSLRERTKAEAAAASHGGSSGTGGRWRYRRSCLGLVGDQLAQERNETEGSET
jgi:hypothetical protein